MIGVCTFGWHNLFILNVKYSGGINAAAVRMRPQFYTVQEWALSLKGFKTNDLLWHLPFMLSKLFFLLFRF